MKTPLFALLCLCTTAFGQMNGIHVTKSPRIIAPASAEELPGLLFRDDLVIAMSKLLWPDAESDVKNGPVDGAYYSLTKAEIEDLLSFVKARREMIPYIPDGFDCDDFALEFYYWSRVWSVRHTGAAPIAPAVGIAYVKLDGPYPLFSGEPFVSGVYHAINVILRNDGQWFFLEPQNGRWCPIDGSIYEGAIEVVKIQI